MSASTRDSARDTGEMKMLPGGTTPSALPGGNGGAAPPAGVGAPASASIAVTVSPVAPSVAAPAPSWSPAPAPSRGPGAIQTRQLSELPKAELEHLAEEYGLDPTAYKTRQHLVVGIHERRQTIAAMDRDAMLDVVRWGRRPVTANASKEQIAQEIARIRTMRFAGLSQQGLCVLARLRGVDARETEPVPVLVKKLKKKEGLFSKLNRKRRSMIAGWVARMIGEEETGAPYGYLPPSG